MSRARSVQDRIGRQVSLLDRLSQVNADLTQLGMVHRVDANTGQQNWTPELERVRTRIERLEREHPEEPGVTGTGSALETRLNACDSLHREVRSRASYTEQRMPEAVFQIVLQRAQKEVDRASRKVHEHGLGQQTATLSARWDEAQIILLLACLLAVVFALLVGMARRLLVEIANGPTSSPPPSATWRPPTRNCGRPC